MGITVRRSQINLGPVVTYDDMAAVGQYIRQRILERTARGVDATGAPFAAYTAAYVERKREALGSMGGVDLMVSGEMQRAITYEVAPDQKSVSVFFAV